VLVLVDGSDVTEEDVMPQQKCRWKGGKVFRVAGRAVGELLYVAGFDSTLAPSEESLPIFATSSGRKAPRCDLAPSNSLARPSSSFLFM